MIGNHNRASDALCKKLMSLRPVAKATGSALTETIVLMLVMLPLLAGVPMIGKLTDLKQASINASRYVAWEETISSDGSSARFVNQRFFKDPSAPLSSSSSEVAEHSLWGADKGLAKGLLVQTNIELEKNSAGSSVSESELPEVASALGGGIESVGEVLAGFSGTSWELTGKGLRSGSVSARIKTNSWMDDRVTGCEPGRACVTARTSILVDGWSAANDQHTATRVRSLVPATVLKPVGQVLSTIGRLPLLKELRPIDDAFGYINMEALPDGTRDPLPGYGDGA